MDASETVTAEEVIQQIDLRMLQVQALILSGGYKFVEGFHARAPILQMAEKLDLEGMRVVVDHVWEMLLTTSDQSTPFREIDEAFVKSATELPKDFVHSWKTYQAKKALDDFSIFFFREDNLKELKEFLRNFTTEEQYEKLICPLLEYDLEMQEYKKLPKILRAMRRPPVPPEKPTELSLKMCGHRK